MGFAAGLMLGGSSLAYGQTLQEALVAAYSNNPTLGAQREALKATDEGVPQALSGWRPTVTLSESYGRSAVDFQNNPNGRPDLVLHPNTTTLSVGQPLYRGGRTTAQTKSAEALVQAGRATLGNTEQAVLLQVVTSYMDVLRDQAVLELTRNNEQVLNRQLDAARDRFRVGEITRTDVSQAESRRSRSTSDRVTAEGNLASSRAVFVRAVGQPATNLTPPPPLTGLPTTQEQALSIGLEENPQLIAAKYTEESSKHDIRTVSGALLPTVSLNGNVSRTSEASTVADLQSTVASVVGQISVPLYEAGNTYSQVRQRRQINSQRIVQVEETSRNVRQAIVQAWENLTTARATIVSRQAQVAAARVALDGVTQEAQVGSRTTLDVLDSEQELLDASVSLVRAQRDEFVASYTLQSAMGRLTARNLALPVQLYDPAENYNRVRDKWWGTDGGLN